ncbi:FtsX-like permease family protein [Microbacterium sp. AZCO]|uniref:ABC transporter permease n=1 Tax=Microbacterium sp. AZCO TaxID=3142976 RepID=UPI0031F372AB
MSARSVGLALKSVTTAPVVSAFVVVFIALVSFAGAAAPALLHSARTATVHAALHDLPPATRDLSGATRGVPRPGTGSSEAAGTLDQAERSSWGYALDVLTETRDAFPSPLRDVLGDPQVVVVSDPVTSVGPPGSALNRITLTFDPGSDERVRIVEGSAPAPRDDEVIEVSLARDAATALGWKVGETRSIAFTADATAELELAGVYEAVDASDPHWTHVPTGLGPAEVVGPLGDITLYATAYGAPDALDAALALPDWFTTQTWLPLAIERVDGASADQLARQMRAASGVQVPLVVVLDQRFPGGLTLSSTVTPPASDQAGRRADAMASIVAFVAVGPFAVAIVVLALAVRLVATRRVRTVRLAEARGASDRLLGGVLGVEGLFLGALGAGLGVAAAALLVGFEGAASLMLPLVIAVTPVLVLPWITLALARRHARRDLGMAPRGGAVRRGAVEGVIVLAAALLTVIAATGTAGVDPALLALPLALSAAACVLALRCVPLVLSAVEARAPRARGLVPLVGPARGRRDPSVRASPVLAVVLGVAVVLFSVAFGATMTAGVSTAAGLRAGADVRVESPYLSARQLDELGAIAGVSHVAALTDGTRIDLDAGDDSVRATVYIADARDFRAVQAASGEGDIPTPDALVAGGDSIPAVVSPALAAALGGAPATLAGHGVDVVAIAPAAARPGSADTWLLVDVSAADRLGAVPTSPGILLMATAPDADPAAVAAAARDTAGPTARVTTPESNAAAISSDPALRTVYLALGAAAVGVALLLALAIGMTLVLGAPGRARLMALLAALGYPRRRDVPLVLWEVGPALVIALPFGVAVGYALTYLALPQLGTATFLGGAFEPAVQTGGWMPLAVVAGFAAFSALAVLIAAAAASRLTASAAVRSMDAEG